MTQASTTPSTAPKPARRRIMLAAALVLIVGVGLASARAAEAQTAPSFVGTPIFSTGGQAAAVFRGGSVADLEAAARANSATGVWLQDATGSFTLLVIGGPAFLRDVFTAKFPIGFGGAVAVTLTRPVGAATPPSSPSTSAPSSTPAPVATPTASSPPRGGILGPSSND